MLRSPAFNESAFNLPLHGLGRYATTHCWYSHGNELPCLLWCQLLFLSKHITVRQIWIS